VYGYLFPLNNTKTVKSFKLPDNGNVEVLAVSLANSPLPVSLQADYNRAGIYTEGTIFTNGLDNDGNALSANLLGATETWHDSLFAYGQPNVTNVVSATGRTISMPQGQYSALLMLAACVNGSQSSQSFTVHYTNGTSTSFIQSMSDWAVPQYFSGETIVEAMGARAGGGSFVPPPVNVYGYTMSLDSNNVVQSLTLPNNGNVEVLALTLSNYTAAVAEAPAIVAQPAGLTVTNGGPASFTVAATGTPALTYQWQLNGTNLTDGGSIGGSSTAALTLSSADATNTGTYDVIVSNSYGSVTSSAVTLNVFFSLQSAVQDSDGSFSFSWLTTPGVPYQVQYTTNLASSNWVDLGAALIASNGVTSATDTNNVDAQRFYRVVQQ
jgi:hypothetical protein